MNNDLQTVYLEKINKSYPRSFKMEKDVCCIYCGNLITDGEELCPVCGTHNK